MRCEVIQVGGVWECVRLIMCLERRRESRGYGLGRGLSPTSCMGHEKVCDGDDNSDGFQGGRECSIFLGGGEKIGLGWMSEGMSESFGERDEMRGAVEGDREGGPISLIGMEG